MKNPLITLHEVLDGLMRRYTGRVPDVSRIIGAMIGEGIISKRAEIENNHIAFRTLGVPNLGVQSLEKIFIAYGFVRRDYYDFPEEEIKRLVVFAAGCGAVQNFYLTHQAVSPAGCNEYFS